MSEMLHMQVHTQRANRFPLQKGLYTEIRFLFFGSNVVHRPIHTQNSLRQPPLSSFPFPLLERETLALYGSHERGWVSQPLDICVLGQLPDRFDILSGQSELSAFRVLLDTFDGPTSRDRYHC